MRPFLYERLFHALLLELASGYYQESESFLSLREMIVRYKVSKPTATLAQESLEKNGLVSVAPRSGCYVLPSAREKALLLLGNASVITVLAPRSWHSKRQRLLGGDRQTVSVLVVFTLGSAEGLPATGHGFLPEEFRSSGGCMEVAQHHGASISFGLHDGSDERQEIMLSLIRSGQISGMLVVEQRPSSAQLDALIREAGKRGMPVVKTGSEPQNADIMHVDFNNVAAGYEATGLLLSRNHRKVTIFTPQSSNQCFQLRLEGARRRAEEEKLELEVHELSTTNLTQAVEERLRNRRFPEAVLCLGHDLAACLCGLLRRRRLVPGRDLSLLSFSSIHTLSPHYTSDLMKMDFNERGAAAMETLVKTLHGNDVHRSTLIPLRYTPSPMGSTLIPHLK